MEAGEVQPAHALGHDRFGRASAPLVHTFEAQHDYEAHGKRLLVRLGSDRYLEREEAHKLLLEMGPVMVPFLRRHRHHPDPEVAVRVQRILEALTTGGP
jgi:hypothetical protein